MPSYIKFILAGLFAAVISAAPTPGPTTYGDAALPEGDVCAPAWVLGYSGDSCTLTCSRVSRTCDSTALLDITSRVAFDEMVEATNFLSSQFVAGITSTALCSNGVNTLMYSDRVAGVNSFSGDGVNTNVNTVAFADVPGIFSYWLYNKALYSGAGYEEERYCYYPTSITPAQADCDVKYEHPPVQRFCPCMAEGSTDCAPTVIPSFAPTNMPTASPTGCFVWLLGKAGSNCVTTCDSISGTCNEPEMLAALGQSDLEDILLVAYAQDSAIHPVETPTYCTSISNPFFMGTAALNTVFATNHDNTPQNHCYYAAPVGTEGPPCTQMAGSGAFSFNPFCACNVPLCSTWENALSSYTDPTLAPVSAP
jgi:hypothetical protein